MKTFPLRGMILGLTTTLLLGAAGVAQAGQFVPLGGEILVNTTTAESQSEPDVAMDDAGSFVVVWESGPIFGDKNVFAQRYGANGVPAGGEFQVNTFAANEQSGSKVGMDANGNFVVTWYSQGQFPPAIFSILGRRYDSAGNPLGGEFEISTGQTAIFQDVAMDADGNFLVVWNGRSAGTFGISSLYARLYDSAGALKTPPFLVYQRQDFGGDFPGVTATPGGGWIITWASDYNFATDSVDILAQRFDAAGNPVGSQAVVPVPAAAARQESQVAASGDRIVVSWVDYSGDGSARARLFDGGLAPLTGELQPSTLPAQPIQDSAVAMDGAGSFVVAWTELAGDLPTRDGSESSIMARAFDAGGNPLGGDFVVNSTAEGFQALPSLAMSSSGRLVAVWSGSGSDQGDIFARVFAPNAAPVARCRDLTVPAGPGCTASASIDDGSFDPDILSVALAQTPAGPYPLGATSVTLTVTGDPGQTSSCTGTVTVVDMTPPAITCPAPLTVDGDAASNGAVVSFTVNASDSCDAATDVVATPASGTHFPFGTTTVQATATDDSGQSAQCTFTVTVQTLSEQVTALIDQINALLSAGLLGSNEANQLINALESVLRELAGPPLALNASNAATGPKLAKNNNKVCKKFDGFLKKVEKIVRKGDIPAAQGQALLDDATALQANLGC